VAFSYNRSEVVVLSLFSLKFPRCYSLWVYIQPFFPIFTPLQKKRGVWSTHDDWIDWYHSVPSAFNQLHLALGSDRSTTNVSSRWTRTPARMRPGMQCQCHGMPTRCRKYEGQRVPILRTKYNTPKTKLHKRSAVALHASRARTCWSPTIRDV